VDPVFGTRVERITNDPGMPTLPLSGRWGRDARHVYSTQQPWNSDGTLLVIDSQGSRRVSSPVIFIR